MFIFLQISLYGRWKILTSCAVLTQFLAVFPAQIGAASLTAVALADTTVQTDICSSVQGATPACKTHL